METIKSGKYSFEIVESIPAGYQIWNIGPNMVDGYLPICETDEEHKVNVETLKAIKLDGAQTVLAAIGGSQNTPEKMERYIKRYRNAKLGTWSHRMVQRMNEALPILRTVVFE